MPSDWREQYDRMKRWQERLWFDPVLHDEHAVDSFFAFAQACYHLVDWLENDRTQHVRRPKADQHVAASPALVFCRDICNGSRHAQLEAKHVWVTSKKTSDVIRLEEGASHSEEIVVERTDLFLDWEGKPVLIESFGRLCVEEWDQFLRAEGLLAAC